MNVELLTKIREKITAEPTKFHMDTWGYAQRPAEDCGTTMCIAGWAVKLSGQPTFRGRMQGTMSHSAMKALDLDHADGDRLFYTDRWPGTFREEYDNAIDRRDYKRAAQVAAERIDQFIVGDDRPLCRPIFRR